MCAAYSYLLEFVFELDELGVRRLRVTVVLLRHAGDRLLEGVEREHCERVERRREGDAWNAGRTCPADGSNASEVRGRGSASAASTVRRGTSPRWSPSCLRACHSCPRVCMRVLTVSGWIVGGGGLVGRSPKPRDEGELRRHNPRTRSTPILTLPSNRYHRQYVTNTSMIDMSSSIDPCISSPESVH
jgi:hypothetical protein